METPKQLNCKIHNDKKYKNSEISFQFQKIKI